MVVVVRVHGLGPAGVVGYVVGGCGGVCGGSCRGPGGVVG